jgi:uncharacterized protein (TIGR02996 family)
MSLPLDRAFLDDIIAHPEDDAPRQIYADWLADNGSPDRAEFIRVQIERACLDVDDPAQDELERREQKLLGKNPAWGDEAGKWLREVAVFRRGFIDEVGCNIKPLLRSAAGMWKRAPITALHLKEIHDRPEALPGLAELVNLRSLWVSGFGRGIAPLANCEQLAGLESLGLDVRTATPGQLATLFTAPLARRLRHLRLKPSVSVEQDARSLLDLPVLCAQLESLALRDTTSGTVLPRLRAGAFPALRELDVGAQSPGADWVREVFSVPWPRLESLDLSTGGIRHENLSTWPGLANVKRLVLTSNQLSDVGIVFFVAGPYPVAPKHLDVASTYLRDASILARCPRLASLTRLNISWNNLGSSVATLVRSPHLRNLRRLNMDATSLRDEGIRALVQAFDLPALTWLNLSYCGFQTEGARQVANCPALARLVGLDLSRNHLPPDSGRYLAESKYLTRLGSLNLARCDLADAGVVALAASPNLAGVWHLDLSQNNIGPTGADALVGSPVLDNLTCLDLRNNRVGAGRFALQQRFGPALKL